MKIFFDEIHDGCGWLMKDRVVEIVGKFKPRYKRVCEFCSGPGFFGFNLLHHGLCESLCLIDINSDVYPNIKKTIEFNGWQNKVDFYHSNCFDNIPDTERWDLVISNPPHSKEQKRRWNLRPRNDLIWQDLDWSLHKNFYANVKRYLNKNAIIVMMENSNYSSINDFWNMSNDGGLSMVDSFSDEVYVQFYYIILRNQRAVRQNLDEEPY